MTRSSIALPIALALALASAPHPVRADGCAADARPAREAIPVVFEAGAAGAQGSWRIETDAAGEVRVLRRDRHRREAGDETTDTSVVVSKGTRLELANFGGSIAVVGWTRDLVRLVADHSARARVTLEREPSVLRVRAVGYMAPANVDYQIHVPRWMALKLSGVHSDITVEDVASDITAETVRGDVEVSGGSGVLDLNAVDGDVMLRGGRGRLSAASVNQDVQLRDCRGEVTAQSVNGDVDLVQVVSDLLEASTVNGTVMFRGPIRDRGRYHFSTHNGDVDFALPAAANATINVSTFNGDFESAFPVRLREARRGRHFSFTVGSGRAQVDLESFQGTIRVQRGE